MRAELQLEFGPKLPWHDASSTSKHMPATQLRIVKRLKHGLNPASRLAIAKVAMVRLGMAEQCCLRTRAPCSQLARQR